MAKKKAESTVRQIRRKTRKKYSAEDKIRIVIEGLRGEMTVAELCRKEGISQSLYYKWSKEFLEAGKQRLAGNTKRQADGGEVIVSGQRTGDQLHMEISNPVSQSPKNKKSGNKMALMNIRQRFELAYGNKASITVSESDDLYSVKIVFPYGENGS